MDDSCEEITLGVPHDIVYPHIPTFCSALRRLFRG